MAQMSQGLPWACEDANPRASGFWPWSSSAPSFLRLPGGIRFIVPFQVDRIWGMWGSYFNILKAIFCLLTGDCTLFGGMWRAK